MSQKLVYEILKELGQATVPEITQVARTKYPDTSLQSCIGDRVQKLKTKGYIDVVKGKQGIRKTRIYKVVAEWDDGTS